MPFQTIEPQRLYRHIATQISALIAQGEFKVGERLPAERDLCARLGVSRASLREALIALEIEGVVDVRSGSGIYVSERRARPSAVQAQTGGMPAVGPFDVIQARALLETEIARLAVQHATDAQVAHVGECLDQLRQCQVDDPRREAADRAFHLALANASGNGAYLYLLSALWEQRTSPLYHRLEGHFLGSNWWAQAMNEHEAIYDALQCRDLDKIRDATQQHMAHAADRLAAHFE
ncbi:FadR/GntR family transcriptional regulator [Burkholderia cenocepacia]|uniref:FadR family transcriptional regulator n=1 Tax=Burkholderia cenocepacia TaxID=95486 RepID=A0ABD4UQ50_9BURK|nr:FadR/GntR family transcriptional regulator [Burkholderia cenocepacia]MCW3698570.1 FadR family transcriptional regulator [Burkholderia cenocepacia]MCW3708148.1 FadR family transcriptional regulator [Burkholderia cenocepacia]MCW3716206.1 FadR family transcriptional regulator [Burkholderia cenocepacia]MCW3724261.1 FadR family transcriptional regulator [Burkholderia cenocepacia]MCW3732350.1 FadR family transcriptional regulator [Burkholderia cenocepacia]